MTETITLGPHTKMLCGSELGKYPWGNPILVEGSDGRMQIDSALDVPVQDVDMVLVSHAHEDHSFALVDVAGLDVRVHNADLEAIQDLDALFAQMGSSSPEARAALVDRFRLGPLPQATGFADGDTIDLGGVTVTVVHLPGHTGGHCGFLVEPDGVFFTADIDLSSFGPYYADQSASLADMRASLERTAEVTAGVYSTYHHKREIRDTAEFRQMLTAFTKVMDDRNERVLALLEQPSTLEELVGKGVVYRPGTAPDYATTAELTMIQDHLDELAAAGAIVHEGGRYQRA